MHIENQSNNFKDTAGDNFFISHLAYQISLVYCLSKNEELLIIALSYIAI